MGSEDGNEVRHLTEAEVYSFITGDFEDAWDRIASKSETELRNRGNFLFALLTTILLEWASRLCQGGAEALNAFGTELEAIEPRYFVQMLGVRAPRREERRGNLCDQVTMLIRRVLHRPVPQPTPTGFELPSGRTVPPVARHQQLLWVLFDLIRNGQAHQYHQLFADLNDETMLEVAVAGVRPGVLLDDVRRELLAGNRPSNHLSLGHDGRHLYLVVWPGVLFLDIQRAIDNANLLGLGLRFPYFTNARIHTTPARLERYLRTRGFGPHRANIVWP